MKNKYRILKILVTVGILIFLLSFSLKRFSNKPMENIKISMDDKQASVYFVDEKDIKSIIKQSNPENKIGTLDIPKLEKRLNDIEFIDSANVYLNLNGTLNLDIKQRVPVFRLLKNGRDFYVDAKGVEFPTSKNYSYPCMLVTGNVKKDEYQNLAALIDKIDKDDFSKKYFIGISKDKGDYNLLTSDANYKVEIGDLNNIDFKVKGFKTFVEKYLVSQDPNKYKKISLKYDNQIVTTLNPYFKDNDSLLRAQKKALVVPIVKKEETTSVKKEEPKKEEKKKETIKQKSKETIVKEKPKVTSAKPKEDTKGTKNKTQPPKKGETKKKTKIVIE
ncbi:cell division protein FtsQ/DivIB [Chryseobacterium sp. T1]